jgi:hypothetical protein
MYSPSLIAVGISVAVGHWFGASVIDTGWPEI